MSIIKSYTNLEQSRKLAEILPLESADMRYVPFGDTHPWVWDEEVKLLEKGSVPCWSLASLFDVLPKKYTELIKEGGMYRIIIKDSYMTCLFDNPVDACYEMIIKLHELNLL